MARMYSRKHGKSGSKKPPYKIVPKWMEYDKKKVEELVVGLAKEKYTSAQIGIILRDQYGIPDVEIATKKSIAKIMKEHELYPSMPEDMMSFLRKAVILRDHLQRNKKDKLSKKGLINLESKIRRLGKYYSRTGELPKNWVYSPEEAKLIVQK